MKGHISSFRYPFTVKAFSPMNYEYIDPIIVSVSERYVVIGGKL
jgi:hypothetical protein